MRVRRNANRKVHPALPRCVTGSAATPGGKQESSVSGAPSSDCVTCATQTTLQ